MLSRSSLDFNAEPTDLAVAREHCLPCWFDGVGTIVRRGVVPLNPVCRLPSDPLSIRARMSGTRWGEGGANSC